MNRSNSEQPLNNRPSPKRKPRPSLMKKANSYPEPSSKGQPQPPSQSQSQEKQQRRRSSRTPTKASTMKVGGPPSSSSTRRKSSLYSTSPSSSPSTKRKFKSPTANKRTTGSPTASSSPYSTPTSHQKPKVQVIQLQQGQSSPTIKIVQPGSSQSGGGVKFIQLPPPIIVPISATRKEPSTSRTEDDDDSSELHDDEKHLNKEKEEPYFSGLLLLLWFLIGSAFIYEIVMTSMGFSNLVKFSNESDCCGHEISVALGGGIILPTIFFALLMGVYWLGLVFMIMAIMKPLSRSRLVPLIHITFTVSPLLQAVLFWFFLPILSSSKDAMIMMIFVSCKLLLQFIAMCLVMRRNLKHSIAQILCHIIVQLHGLAGIMVLYFWIIQGNDGLCYVVGTDGFALQGCELCPPINGILGEHYPPINGECLGSTDNNNDAPTLFVNELPSGTYCSDDDDGTNFCFYEY